MKKAKLVHGKSYILHYINNYFNFNFSSLEPIKFNLETKMSYNYNKIIYKILMFGCWATHPPKKTKKSSKVIKRSHIL